MTDEKMPLPRPGFLDVGRALLARAFVRAEVRNGWQWYRRACGGMWSRRTDGAWARVTACPGRAHAASLRVDDPVPAGVCYEFSTAVLGADGTVIAHAVTRECHCEAWR